MDPTSNDPPTIESVLNAWGVDRQRRPRRQRHRRRVRSPAVLDFELGSSAGGATTDRDSQAPKTRDRRPSPAACSIHQVPSTCDEDATSRGC